MLQDERKFAGGSYNMGSPQSQSGCVQVFGGDHKLTQWMTAPSLEALCGEELMGAPKHKASHMKQVLVRSSPSAIFAPRQAILAKTSPQVF